MGDLDSIPVSGRSPGEGNGNPPQHSSLENPMDWVARLRCKGLQRVGHDWETKHERWPKWKLSDPSQTENSVFFFLKRWKSNYVSYLGPMRPPVCVTDTIRCPDVGGLNLWFWSKLNIINYTTLKCSSLTSLKLHHENGHLQDSGRREISTNNYSMLKS